MPFTFLPHQAPLLPLVGGARRWDGVALVAGSMAPDLFYVTNGWGYGPLGIALWFDGHAARNLPWVVLLAVVLTVVVRRAVMPVLPFALPDVGDLDVRQYAAAARHRYPWWITVGSAAVGAVSHIVWDSFTHNDGAAVKAIPALGTSVAQLGARHVRIATLLQYGSSAVGVVAALVILRRLAAEGRIAHGEPVPDVELDGPGRAVCLAGIVLGIAGGVGYAWSRSGTHQLYGQHIESGISVVVMAFAWVAFLGTVLGSVLARPRLVARPAHQPRSIHS